MLGLYGSPMRASRKVPIVSDAGAQVPWGGLKGTVTVSGSYQITEQDLDGSGTVTNTRVYTGTVSGSLAFEIPRIDLDPRYLNSASAYYIEPPMDSFAVIRHPRWCFPSFATGLRGFSSNRAMELTRATLLWNDDSSFSTTPITDFENLTIEVTRETTPDHLAPYDNHLSKTYHDTLGGQIILVSDRGKLLWTPTPIINNGTDYPATGTVNAEFYQYDIVDPFPAPGEQELITDIHRTELGTEQVVVIHQPHQPNEATDFFTRTYDTWNSTWTYKLQAV